MVSSVNTKGNHSVKSVQIRSFFWSVFSCIRTESVFSPNTGKYKPEKTDIFYEMGENSFFLNHFLKSSYKNTRMFLKNN